MALLWLFVAATFWLPLACLWIVPLWRVRSVRQRRERRLLRRTAQIVNSGGHLVPKRTRPNLLIAA